MKPHYLNDFIDYVELLDYVDILHEKASQLLLKTTKFCVGKLLDFVIHYFGYGLSQREGCIILLATSTGQIHAD